MSERETPNPGSPEAVERGCTCPVPDNNHGEGVETPGLFGPVRDWWRNSECPLHGCGEEDRP
jgi:hypothetical protein